MGVKIFLDSGAFSFYNRLSKAKSANASDTGMGRGIQHAHLNTYDYVKSEAYKTYRQGYVDFVKEHGEILEVHANLDVIGNAELSYKNQKWLEKRGLTPLPVWHMGSDKKWLHRYLDEGYEYICIGGMVGSQKSILRPALDALWRKDLTTASGTPKVKVHAFGMTIFEFMFRYPWYSVDSNSWNDYGRRGRLLIPSFKGMKRDYAHPKIVYTTARSIHQKSHFRTFSEGKRRGVLRYLADIGIPLGKSEFRSVPSDYTLKPGEQWSKKPEKGPRQVETTIEKGVINDYFLRDNANFQFYLEVEKSIPPWPWKLSPSIKQGKRGLLT